MRKLVGVRHRQDVAEFALELSGSAAQGELLTEFLLTRCLSIAGGTTQILLSLVAERLLDWRANIASLGRVILVTPGTPKERVDYLRAALADVLRDPAFIAEIKKVNLAAGYLGADEVQAAVEKAMTTLDAKGLADMKDIALNRYYN